MVERQERRRLVCDECFVKSDWMVVGENPEAVADPVKGWRQFDLSSVVAYGSSVKDYCSKECFLKAVDEEYKT